MMKFGKRILSGLLTCALTITLFGEVTARAANDASSVWKTPQQAVSEMTWGVNLSDLYIADVGNPDGSTTGYIDLSSLSSKPFDFAAWFWNQNYVGSDWGIHESTFSVSLPFPDYDYSSVTDWIGGLFTLGIVAGEELSEFSVTLSGSKITKNGASVGDVSFLDRTYPLDSNIQYNPSNNNYTHWLWLGSQNYGDLSSQLPNPGASLNGAVFETTVTVNGVTDMTEEEKADSLFQYDRIPMDPEELTDLFLNQGANVIRLPVTWTPFINDQTFKIDEAWLKKVQTEVDYILSQGAYCILDMHNDYMLRSFVGISDGAGGWTDLHWETEWMYNLYKPYVDARFVEVWTQIATYFKDYPQKLIFEPFNEPTMEYHGDFSDLQDTSKYQYAFDEQVGRYR